MTIEHRLAVIADAGELAPEPVHVMDGVVHADAHRDGGDGDGHYIQRDIQPAHHAQHEGGGDHIGDDTQHGDGKRAEQKQEHQHYGEHHHAEGEYLRLEQTLQHIVIHHQYAGEAHLLVAESELIFQAGFDALQQLVAVEVVRRFDHPHIEAHLIVGDGDEGQQHALLQVVGDAVVEDAPQQGVYGFVVVEFLRQFDDGAEGEHLAGVRVGGEVVVDGFD